MQTLIKNYGETDFITGLRGIAASLVVIIHTGAFSTFGEIGAQITHSGKLGVEVFFVIAGFTIAQTRNQAASFAAYIRRRLLRLLPLYYSVLALCVTGLILGITWNEYYTEQVGALPLWADLLLHMTFLSWLDVRTGNSLIGVEWTLPIELFWYVALLPFLNHLTTTVWRAILMLGVLIGASHIIFVAYEQLGLHPWVWKWSPWQYGWYFAFGAIAWRLRQVISGYFVTLQMIGILLFIAALLGAKNGHAVISLSTMLLIISVGRGRLNPINGILVSKPFKIVGSLSYGIYLVHLPIAYTLQTLVTHSFILFLITFTVSICLSLLLTLFIETPVKSFFTKHKNT